MIKQNRYAGNASVKESADREEEAKNVTAHTVKCVLYDRDCIGCLECETCDLNPDKVCDNCGKCLDIQDVASIKIDKVYLSEEEYETERNKRS